MFIVFRCDASIQIGTGHVMRCLTLANALKVEGVNCLFVCRQHEGHLANKIIQEGHQVELLPAIAEPLLDTDNQYSHWLGVTWQTDAQQTIKAIATRKENRSINWLVVDHYGLDAKWERELSSICDRIMVVDDLANREHDCDLLLDQNLGREESDYKNIVSTKTKLLIGPTYALLRPEFAQWRDYSLNRRRQPELKRILVTMGGIDKDNVTCDVLYALADTSLPKKCSVTVVMGTNAPWLEQVQEAAKKQPYECKVLVDVNNIAEIMANSDLAIGAAGSTSWERCCLGLPTITLVLAKNQKTIADALARQHLAWKVESVTELSTKLNQILSSSNEHISLTSMIQFMVSSINAQGSSRIIDALGVTS